MLEFCSIEALWLLNTNFELREWLSRTIVDCRPLASTSTSTIVKLGERLYIFDKDSGEAKIEGISAPLKVGASEDEIYIFDSRHTCSIFDKEMALVEIPHVQDIAVMRYWSYRSYMPSRTWVDSRDTTPVITIETSGSMVPTKIRCDRLNARIVRYVTGYVTEYPGQDSKIETLIDALGGLYIRCGSWDTPGYIPTSGTIDVACGREHLISLDTDGVVWELGRGLLRRRSVDFKKLRQLSLMGRAVAIASGANHSAILLEDGRVECLGDNEYGQLGYDCRGPGSHGRNSNIVSLPAPAIAVSCGMYFTVALTLNGEVYGWGKGYGLVGQIAFPI